MIPSELRDTLQRAKSGDESAQRELLERFYPAVSSLVHQRLQQEFRRGRPWLAALFSTGDVVQDVLAGVWRDIDGFAGDDIPTFERFLASMVTHRLIDAIRFHEASKRDARRVGRDVDLAALDAHDLDGHNREISPTRHAAAREATDAVDDALAALQERDRRLIELRFRDQLTHVRIAEVLEMPSEDAVRKALRRAQARLLVKLRARGIE